MTDKYYIGWVRSGKDGKGLVKYRPRKHIANAVTTSPPGCLPTLMTVWATPLRISYMNLNKTY